MSNLINKLTSLKQKMERLDKDISLAEGKKQVYMKQLKEEWECDSIEEAEVLIKDIANNIKTLEKQKQEALDELNKTYGWEL